MRFNSKKSNAQSWGLGVLGLKSVCMLLYLSFAVTAVIIEIITVYAGRPSEIKYILSLMWQWIYIMPLVLLTIGFFTPFCLPFIFSGEVEEIQPWLVGFQGMIPIEQLGNLVFGNYTGRLNYTASSGLLCSRETLTRKGIAPILDMNSIPAGHQIFSLLDTVSRFSPYPVWHLLNSHPGKPNGYHLLRAPPPHSRANLRE